MIRLRVIDIVCKEMKEWIDKHSVMRWCSIKPTTYKKRLKRVNPLDKKSGYRGKTYINPDIVYSTFCPNTFPIKELKSIKSYSHSIEWDFFGNIVPVSSRPDNLICKWEYLIDIWSREDENVEIVYSIESNSQDTYFHSHFLLKTFLPNDFIYRGLKIVCDENNRRESRIHLAKFNPEIMSGIDYNHKDPVGGVGHLVSQSIDS